MTVTASDDIAASGEDMGLDELDFAVSTDRRIGHDEQRIAEGFELGSTVHLEGVFDGQLMQVELFLQLTHLFGVGLFQADPYEMPRTPRPLRAVVEADVSNLLARAVYRGGDHSAHDAHFFDWQGDPVWACCG